MIFLVIFLLHLGPVSSFSQQRANPVLLAVEEVSIPQMKYVRRRPGDLVLLVMEQYVDLTFAQALVSAETYPSDPAFKQYIPDRRDSFWIGVMLYPENNGMVYAQVYYRGRFFFAVLQRREGDFIMDPSMTVIKTVYQYGSPSRRNQIIDAMRPNFIRLGIE